MSCCSSPSVVPHLTQARTHRVTINAHTHRGTVHKCESGRGEERRYLRIAKRLEQRRSCDHSFLQALIRRTRALWPRRNNQAHHAGNGRPSHAEDKPSRPRRQTTQRFAVTASDYSYFWDVKEETECQHSFTAHATATVQRLTTSPPPQAARRRQEHIRLTGPCN